MLRVRVIPTLLIKERDLVKSLNFQNYIYVGDPINTIKIFNEKSCDEIFIYDISEDRSKPIDFEYLKIIACESRMPVGYGGRVNSIEDIERILSIGIEKISLNSILFSNEKLLIDASKKFGKQSIVATVDIKKINTNYFIHTKNGKEKINIDLNKYLKFLQEYVGELIIQSIDNDGTMNGYDLELFDLVFKDIQIPFVFLGGAGKYDHLKSIVEKKTISGCGVGSYFIFKKKRGVVLINYLSLEERRDLDQIFDFL